MKTGAKNNCLLHDCTQHSNINASEAMQYSTEHSIICILQSHTLIVGTSHKLISNCK